MLGSNYEQLGKLAMITVVFFRESISECKLPETPEQGKNVFRIPVGVPGTSASSMEEEDPLDEKDKEGGISGDTKKSNPTKRKKGSSGAEAAGGKLSDSDDDELEKLAKEAETAEKHRRMFDVAPWQAVSCLMKFNPLEILPKSRFVAVKLWHNEGGKYTGLRNMQNRNMIIFF